ncbi:hypothetical protein, partial [Streptomyces sp. NPDC059003]|uniref:hypothetical protein n=1 Tax=Streptomyces sp. NPDC059003 TaxID=3346691 RepID=UPI0036BE6943
MTVLAVDYGTKIDLTNPGFIEIYAYAFGVSTVLTIILWLFAVAKRAAQGVEFSQALTESIGYLLISVMVTAFAPAAVAYTVKLMDGAAESLLASQSFKLAILSGFVVLCLAALTATGIGAPLAVLIGFTLILIILGIWLLLVVRNSLILCGLVFGPTVFSGLVNKDLWKHTRTWAGLMVAVISVKYAVYAVLALAIAYTEGLPKNPKDLSFGQALGTVMTVFALFATALISPFFASKFLTIFGDEMQSVLGARKAMVDQAQSAYKQGKGAYDGLKGVNNPRLNDAAGDSDDSDADDSSSDSGGPPSAPGQDVAAAEKAAAPDAPQGDDAQAAELSGEDQDGGPSPSSPTADGAAPHASSAPTAGADGPPASPAAPSPGGAAPVSEPAPVGGPAPAPLPSAPSSSPVG